jgi:hypothetical protein
MNAKLESALFIIQLSGTETRREQLRVNLSSTWGQPGVNMGSTWGQPGVNLHGHTMRSISAASAAASAAAAL